MSQLVDLNGQIITEEELDCMTGTEMLGQMVRTTIQKDDLVYKLRLHFGTTTYETRVPYHEFNEETKQNVWKDLLTQAFSNHDIGKMNRGMVLSGIKQE